MRNRILSLLAALAMAAAALPAAARPDVYPPEYWEDTFTLEAGFPCDFDIALHLSGKEGAIFFENRAILTAPGFRAQLSANGVDLDISIAGSFHETYDGDAAHGVATGRNVLFGTFGGEPGLFLTIGAVEYLFDFATGDWTILNHHTMIDLCEVLAG
jgi:hypothetical protein